VALPPKKPGAPRIGGPAVSAGESPGLVSGLISYAKSNSLKLDFISFHNYDDAAEFEKRVKWLQRYNRPLLCTEYMARGNKSTFEGTLPVAKKHKVAAINWGFVAGKTQTNLPWDSWQKPYVDREPAVWFHEIFYPDGRPYRAEEVDLIRKLTGKTGR